MNVAAESPRVKMAPKILYTIYTQYMYRMSVDITSIPVIVTVTLAGMLLWDLICVALDSARIGPGDRTM